MKTAVVVFSLLALISCIQKAKESNPGQVPVDKTTALEKEDWEMLFDGKSFNGWHFYNGGEVTEPWKLEDGAMVFYPPKDYPKGTSYNLVTDKEYTNFVLSLEWKVSKGGNSGIFWGIFEDESYGQPYQTGPEIQVLDNENHPGAKAGTTHQAGALYDMMAPSKKVVKPVGQWNQVKLTIDHNTNKGQVVINGTTILEFPVHGEAWQAMVANSKFADWEGFGTYRTGRIGLQDHGDIVTYRNIKIKEL